MPELHGDLVELRNQLDKGRIQKAYTAIISYMSGLRTHFDTHKDWVVSGLYQGYFDMTYFAVLPPLVKARNLKLAVVFDYEKFGFQVWLAARNRAVQHQYFKLFRDCGWPAESLVEPAVGVDAIVRRDVANGLDLDEPNKLTAAINRAVKSFLTDLELFLEIHDPQTV
ncbi:MAG TPA: hypothetical protein PKN24_06270 [bacterium]|nr:hypothetical protein [bacterium]